MEIFCVFTNGRKGRKHQLSSLEKAGGGKQPPTNIISTTIISTNNDYLYPFFLNKKQLQPKKAFLRFFGGIPLFEWNFRIVDIEFFLSFQMGPTKAQRHVELKCGKLLWWRKAPVPEG